MIVAVPGAGTGSRAEAVPRPMSVGWLGLRLGLCLVLSTAVAFPVLMM